MRDKMTLYVNLHISTEQNRGIIWDLHHLLIGSDVCSSYTVCGTPEEHISFSTSPVALY